MEVLAISIPKNIKKKFISNPQPIEVFSIDVDPIIYKACYRVEKTLYYFKDLVTGENSQVFKSAREANDYLEMQKDYIEDAVTRFERVSTKDVGTIKEAEKAADNVVREYLNLCKSHTTVSDFKWKGFLTKSGTKNKEHTRSEHKYMLGRDNVTKPEHHSYIRDYIYNKYPEIIYAPEGFEADSVIIAYAEKFGYKGCAVSIDKDIGTAENTFFINAMDTKDSKLIKIDELGYLYLETDLSNPEGKGVGFKFLSYQTLAGDKVDDVKGVKGIGSTKALKILDDCTTTYQCVQAVYNTHRKVYGEEYTFHPWDSKDENDTITLSAYELTELNYSLVYQERSKKDVFKLDKYLTEEQLKEGYDNGNNK